VTFTVRKYKKKPRMPGILGGRFKERREALVKRKKDPAGGEDEKSPRKGSSKTSAACNDAMAESYIGEKKNPVERRKLPERARPRG